MTKVSIAGSTGSIGTQALEVVSASGGRFEVETLVAHRSAKLVSEQAAIHRPRLVGLVDDSAVAELDLPAGTEVVAGAEALAAAAESGDVVLNAVVGFAGLPVTLKVLESGRRLALANKESLVAGGPLVRRLRKPGLPEVNDPLVPVDSEHGALHQCLAGLRPEAVSRLLLTASGGPFRGRSAAELSTVTADQALAHPTWNMGPKVTIDSSTLVNKGLEVIEAHELFGIDYDQIEVVVHPQSVVHSMVETVDGSVLAQLSLPDMRLPIGYALGWPERFEAPFGKIDWSCVGALTFEQPDRSTFGGLDLAYQAARAGGTAPAWFNAANEVAVDAFLAGALRWVDIAGVIASTLDACQVSDPETADDVIEADRAARRVAEQSVKTLSAAA